MIKEGIDGACMRHYSEGDMSQLTREWRVINEMPASSVENPIRQVYVWLLTEDDHVVIVSKDGDTWQLPGGKPDAEEDASETAVREVLEETGIDIADQKKDLTYFGVYTINEPNSVDNPPLYRQVRTWLRLPAKSCDIKVTTMGESSAQHPEDAVRFVKKVPAEKITDFIPWLPRADEYKYLKRKNIIKY